MNSAPSVRPFFLIFCMKLVDMRKMTEKNTRKMTGPDFSEKFSLAQKRAKTA